MLLNIFFIKLLICIVFINTFVKDKNTIMAGYGEKNSKSRVTDAQAIHIKFIAKIQMKGKKTGDIIKYIQQFYDLNYSTIYNIIWNRYKHLDSQVNNMIYRKPCGR